MRKSCLALASQGFPRRFSEVKVSLRAAVALCLLSGLIVWGLTFYSFKVAMGEVRVIGVGVGVYWDSNCDNPVSSFSWGKIVVNPLRPEASKNASIYVRNEENEPIAIHLNASAWLPQGVENYISLDWDYDGTVLGVNEVIKVTLSLSIDSRIWFESPRIHEYSFDIVISAVSS